MMRPIFFLFFLIFFLFQALSGYELDLRQCRLDSSGRTLFQTIDGKEKQVGRIRLEKPAEGSHTPLKYTVYAIDPSGQTLVGDTLV